MAWRRTAQQLVPSSRWPCEGQVVESTDQKPQPHAQAQYDPSLVARST